MLGRTVPDCFRVKVNKYSLEMFPSRLVVDRSKFLGDSELHQLMFLTQPPT